MIITDHAAERFIERIAPGTSLVAAKARLAANVGTAAKMRQKTASGESIYVSDSLNCRLVVRGSQFGESQRVVITVLPLNQKEQDSEVTIIDEEDIAPLNQTVPEFDLMQVMADLTKGSSGMRTMVLTGLSRAQLMDVRAENTKRTHEAIARKRKDEITNLNGLAICIKDELRKRPNEPPAPPAQLSPTPNALTEQVRSLRRELGRMLFKYGWIGNEDSHEVYKRAKGGDTSEVE